MFPCAGCGADRRGLEEECDQCGWRPASRTVEFRSSASEPDPQWAWIQYVPLKLHKVVPWAGALLGMGIGSAVDRPDVGAWVGFILAIVPGVYVQTLKRKYQAANRSATAGSPEIIDEADARNWARQGATSARPNNPPQS